PVVHREEGILERREDAASCESADHRRENHPPSRAGTDHVSVLPAEASIEEKARGGGEALECPVRMDDHRPQVEVRRKAHAPPRKLGADTPRSLPSGLILRLTRECDRPRMLGAGSTPPLRAFGGSRRRMDAFSEVLNGVRLKGAMFFRAEFSAPWRLSTPHRRALAPALAPDAPHMLLYHFVVDGSARASLS